MKNQNGSAIIEIIPAAVFVALFIAVCIRFSAFFTKAVRDVANAESKASAIVNEWDASHSGRGFERPCLENIPEDIGVLREVRIVRRPVCISW